MTKKVLGLGNALVDILTIIESDKTLTKLGIPKGSMQLIDSDKMSEISDTISNLEKKMATGGSVANTIRGLSNLGLQTGFIGKIGHDDIGKFFKKDIEQLGVKAQMLYSKQHSGCCTALISPDSERTMCTYLGAASELTADDINISQFDGFDIFHIEGYLVQNHELIEKAVKLAKEAGLKVSLDLASYNIVEENRDFLCHLMKNYIDFAFANEEEAIAFTGKAAEEALQDIANLCEIAIVKVGKEGSFIQRGEQTFRVETPIVKAIDTTGAGDLYASGFLYGIANDMDLQRCGEIGSFVASKVVQTIGTTIQPEVWKEIKKFAE